MRYSHVAALTPKEGKAPFILLIEKLNMDIREV